MAVKVIKVKFTLALSKIVLNYEHYLCVKFHTCIKQCTKSPLIWCYAALLPLPAGLINKLSCLYLSA